MKNYQFLEKLKSFYFIEKIILYGSRARGDHSEKSDMDLAIVCPDATKENWLMVLDVIDNADTLLKVDCVRFDTLGADSLLKKNILSEGMILYEKNSH